MRVKTRWKESQKDVQEVVAFLPTLDSLNNVVAPSPSLKEWYEKRLKAQDVEMEYNGPQRQHTIKDR